MNNANQGPQPTWDARVREAAVNVESDVRRLISYINDEVMPDVRRNGSSALRSAAGELQRLAERMEESNHARTTPAPPPAPKP